MTIKTLTSVHEITHHRQSRVRGSSGGATPTRATVGTNPKLCRIQPRTAIQDEEFMSRDEQTTHFVYFHEDPSAEPRDEFDFVHLGSTLLLEVLISIEFDFLERLWRVECVEIKKKGR